MGPYATQIFGDMGADVIKVEPPEGDIFRHALPTRSPRMGAPFMNFNRNKRSVCLDIKQADDRQALFDLVKDRSEEHTSELQSLMRISYAVFCLTTKTKLIKRRLMMPSAAENHRRTSSHKTERHV